MYSHIYKIPAEVHDFTAGIRCIICYRPTNGVAAGVVADDVAEEAGVADDAAEVPQSVEVVAEGAAAEGQPRQEPGQQPLAPD